MPVFIDADQSGAEPCLINVEGIAAISFHEKSERENAFVYIRYINGSADRYTNYSNREQSFDLEDIAAKLTSEGVEFVRDQDGWLFFPPSVVYIKYCPSDGPNNTPQLALGVLGVEREMRVNGTDKELARLVDKICANRPFVAFDMEQTSYSNAANPTKVHVDTSAVRLIRDQAYFVKVQFEDWRPELSFNVKIKVGLKDIPADASEAFKAAVEKQRKDEQASLKPLAIELARHCPQLLKIHASLDSGKSILYVAPENIARIEKFEGYWYLNVTLRSKVAGHDGQLVQVDCGSKEAMEAAFDALTAKAAKPVPAARKPGPK